MHDRKTGRSFLRPLSVVIALCLLAAPATFAQRGGGRGGAGGAGRRPVICIYDCRDLNSSNSDADDAKIAHLMAVQASGDQSAAFVTITKLTEDATKQLKAFRDLQQNAAPLDRISKQGDQLEDLLNKARAGNRNFVAALNPTQASGLKEPVRKLARADADLDREIKNLDHVLDPKPDSKQLAAATVSLDKALTAFQNEQLALGTEMSALPLADRHETAFNLEPFTSALELGGQSISIPAAGAIALPPDDSHSPIPSTGVSDTYSIRFVADLSDLQDNITAILRSALDQGGRCGSRVEIKEAILVPQPPAALVTTHLHYERWICPPGTGAATELADSDGSIELKLTPSLDAQGAVQLSSQNARVDAQGLLRDALLTGDLGDTMREQITASVLAALRKGAEVKNTLPPAALPLATIEQARFKDAGTGHLSLVLDGQLKLVGESTKEFAAQLKQRLSAQGTTTP
jgi:hypothetical protein